MSSYTIYYMFYGYVYAVNLPLDLEDAKLARMLEACGKTLRYLRPVDPISEVPSVRFTLLLCAPCHTPYCGPSIHHVILHVIHHTPYTIQHACYYSYANSMNM
ncbi:hypothetical protein EON64_09155, partial [archaeon]